MSGDSEYFQPPTLPPKSLWRFLLHFSLPARSKQTSSPIGPRAMMTLPSVVGVARLPFHSWLPSECSLPTLDVQTTLPSAAFRQWRWVSPALSPSRKILSPSVDTPP